MDYSSDVNGVTDPQGPSEGEKRICRGGYYSQSRKYLRSSSRESNNESSQNISVGIRLCTDS